LISQMAVNAASGPLGGAISKGAGLAASGGDISAAIGPLGLTPSQLVTSGHLKPGADTIISKINTDPTKDLKVPTNLFTGKDGITNLTAMTGLTGQTNAAKDLLGTGLKGLTGSGLLSGKESASQIGGLALSAVTGGLGPTLAFAGGAGGLGALAGAASGLGLKLPANPLGGDPSSLIAGGNFAAGLAGKALNPLGGINVADDLKGAASGVFDKIKSKFKALKVGEPVSLTVAKAEAEASSDNPLDAAKDAMSSANSLAGGVGSLAGAAGSLGSLAKGALGNIDTTSLLTTAISASTGIPPQLLSAGLSVAQGLAEGKSLESVAASSLVGATGLPTDLSAKSLAGSAGLPTDALGGLSGAKSMASNPASTFGALSGVSLGGVGSMPGGASAISNVLNGNPLASGSIPGVSSLTSLAGGISGLSSVQGLLGSAKSLSSLASTGLSAADSASLSASIASLGMPGAVKVALPTTLVDANNIDSIKAQSASLLGDSKIPSLSFGSVKTVPLSASDIKEYDAIKKQATETDDKYWELRKELADAAYKFGADSSEAMIARESLKANQKLKEDLNKQLASLASKGLSTS
jgi:hypothetical protein